MDLKSFREYTLLRRRAEYLKKRATQAYQDDPIKVEKMYSDVNDVALSGLNERSGAENYTCAGRVYSPFRVRRRKRDGRFVKRF
jgi:hypothetical protein